MAMNEFTEEDMEEVVIPLRRVAVAFGQALLITVSRPKIFDEVDKCWEEFADELAMFVKLTEEK